MKELNGVRVLCLGPERGFEDFRRVIEGHGGEVRISRDLQDFQKVESTFSPNLILMWLFRGTQEYLNVIPTLQKAMTKVPVLVVTDRMNLDLYLKALTLGAFDALSQPVNESELLRVTARALRDCPEGVLSAVA